MRDVSVSSSAVSLTSRLNLRRRRLAPLLGLPLAGETQWARDGLVYLASQSLPTIYSMSCSWLAAHVRRSAPLRVCVLRCWAREFPFCGGVRIFPDLASVRVTVISSAISSEHHKRQHSAPSFTVGNPPGNRLLTAPGVGSCADDATVVIRSNVDSLRYFSPCFPFFMILLICVILLCNFC
ncbi:hypothetical protein TcBrA4_0139550 [Trypanosoma cruzi]|nr:hypothetical protein TcBrA4_0139550 [Trypanosoma cruzi]